MYCNIFGMLSASRKESQTLCNDRVASSGLAKAGKGDKGEKDAKLAPPVSVEASEFAPGEALRETIAEND